MVFVQKDVTEHGEKTHNRPLAQGWGDHQSMRITYHPGKCDAKLILQRAALNAIRMMFHFYDKYSPERKCIGNKSYLCTPFPPNQYNALNAIYKKNIKNINKIKGRQFIIIKTNFSMNFLEHIPQGDTMQQSEACT